MGSADHEPKMSDKSVPLLSFAAWVSELCPLTESGNGTEDTVSASESWHDELTLMGDLSTLNTKVAAYVVRALNADAMSDEPTAPAQEHGLGARLIELGERLQARAIRRSADTRDPIPTEQSARDPVQSSSREPQTPWGDQTAAIHETSPE
ncbi:hypothetical protein [Actinophytocola sp.]|uniref:hypothetical protein n=1 Tax=Actinophytocola sp. TaxID=1872138 RepID=UPI002ED5EE2C